MRLDGAQSARPLRTCELWVLCVQLENRVAGAVLFIVPYRRVARRENQDIPAPVAAALTGNELPRAGVGHVVGWSGLLAISLTMRGSHAAAALLLSAQPLAALTPAIQLPEIRVLLHAERYCVVEKPAGMLVHRNAFTKRRDVVLVQALRHQFDRDIAPVHRLDGGTSGCIFFSFDAEMTKQLQAALQNARARKTYYAFCRGDASHLTDLVVDRPIKDANGVTREAQTHFECVAACEGVDRSSLLVARPVTGRWHQIRRHLNGLGHPIVGDSKHGDCRINRHWRTEHGMAHLGLHCAEISLTLDDGHTIDVRCPVRPELLKLWQRLPWWEQACEALPVLRLDAEEMTAAREIIGAEETASMRDQTAGLRLS